ncbi:MAG: hypothetical protein QNK16_06935, partial [Woeseiaceae bacterium]|nr:hypothetical protein [Woeseiaceae bacterium]MDX2608098.1 hypothetical protein [Woeseiaceae bacterium]
MAHSGDSSSSPLRRFAALLMGVLLLSAIAAAETPLVPHTAEYRIKIKVLGGKLLTELKRDGDAYIATHIVKPTGMSRILANGSITESSSFLSAADGLRPDKYWSADSLSRDKSKVEIQFDWETGEARGTV